MGKKKVATISSLRVTLAHTYNNACSVTDIHTNKQYLTTLHNWMPCTKALGIVGNYCDTMDTRESFIVYISCPLFRVSLYYYMGGRGSFIAAESVLVLLLLHPLICVSTVNNLWSAPQNAP